MSNHVSSETGSRPIGTVEKKRIVELAAVRRYKEALETHGVGRRQYAYRHIESVIVPSTLPCYDSILQIERIRLKKSQEVSPVSNRRSQSGFCSESETRRILLGNDPEASEYPLS